MAAGLRAMTFVRMEVSMDQKKYIEMGLNGEAPLKVILRGNVVTDEKNKIGVVSVVYATMDRDQAEAKISELLESAEAEDSYFMVYSVPLDVDLTTLEHFPSIAITKEDLA